LLVVQPGLENQLETNTNLDELGIVFCDWETAVREHGDLLEEYQGAIVSEEEGKFSALSAALASSGAFLHVPAGVQLEDPLHVIQWAPGSEIAFFTRLLVVVESDASITMVNEYASPTEVTGEAIHGGIVELMVAEGAKLNFIELQSFGEHVWNFTHERAKVGRQAELDWIYGAVGSQLTKNFTELNMEGSGARGVMSGFYFSDNNQHLDHDTLQNHLSPNTTSDLLFKGALVDNSRSVWQGMIYVAPGAQMTDGYQANKNLILSQDARADSIPGLEILADDVRCSHGATVGRLEEESLFYLMSRGLPRREAERLIIDGFFAPVMERIPFHDVRERFQRMINKKLV
jgi:Fe-S cluster assembly protein SufD